VLHPVGGAAERRHQVGSVLKLIGIDGRIEGVQRLARGGAREGKDLRRRACKQDGVESLCGW
jgi:hypothetical protein